MANNEELVKIFQDLAYYYDKDHENNKYIEDLYLKTANIISLDSRKITSSAQLIKKEVGKIKGVSDIISEYNKNKKVDKLIKLKEKYGGKSEELNKVEDKKEEIKDIETEELINYFSSFYGIGKVKATKIVDGGYKTIEELWDDKDKMLTQAQQDGIIWHDHINEKIPRSEINLISELLHSILDTIGVKWIIAGSYRRNAKESGDIDLLIQKESLNEADPNFSIEEIIKLLGDYLPVILTQGEKKSAAIFQLDDTYLGRRIDILLIPEKSWNYALLYFTGSATFNVLIREKAKLLGYKLNEYSLINEDNKEINVNNEKDIFEKLNLKYLSPEKRLNNLQYLL